MMTIRSEARLSRRPWGITRIKRAMLAKVNEYLLKVNLTLHPTKGFRKVNPMLSMASMLVQGYRQGKMRYELQAVRELIIGTRMDIKLAGDYT